MIRVYRVFKGLGDLVIKVYRGLGDRVFLEELRHLANAH